MKPAQSSKFRSKSGYNFALAFRLAWKSLRHHRLVSLATMLGVATGMCVVSAILIVDHNTARTDNQQEQLAEAVVVNDGEFNGVAGADSQPRVVIVPIRKIRIIKRQEFADQDRPLLQQYFPTQQLQSPVSSDAAPTPKGEEDYQTMRLAIRMASVFAFFIGSVIVFYTMRFSVAMRIREFALLLCLGEHQRNVSLSLLFESIVLGMIGTFTGLLAAFPAAKLLLAMGISTTGRTPASAFSIPYSEISFMVIISLFIVLLGVISPIRTIFRFQLSQVLQPRFVEGNINQSAFQYTGFSWLIPAMLLASYLALRPFLESWLSVVYFFLLEAIFIVVLVLLTIWLTRPFLRIGIRLIEWLLQPLLPLETLLTVRRIRLTSHKFVFSVTGVILVFSLLSGLHAITSSLKHEIYHWSSEAIEPYVYYERSRYQILDEAGIVQIEKNHGLHIFRMSTKVQGSFPVRLVRAEDINRYRAQSGQTLFNVGQVIFSRTLAARYGAQVGDVLQIETDTTGYNFDILEIGDGFGTFAEDGQYVDIKSFALFTDGNPLFSDNVELTLGDFAVMRKAGDDRSRFTEMQKARLWPYYQFDKSGLSQQKWQLREIDRDFLIFDFILVMTVILAFIGIVNTLLIQVHSRSRELSILKTLGINRRQMFSLLLVEGLVVGIIGSLLAVLLGTALGLVSVSFLDKFTLFQYEYVWSAKTSALIAGFAVFTCCISAIYPAMIANRISTAESLHYE